MKRIFVIGILLLFCLLSFSQNEANYTQYMFNPLNYNPAYAGNKRVFSALTVYRNQWVGIDGAPKTFTFAAHSPVNKRNLNIGVGLEITSDRIGPINNTKIQGTYAYRFRVNRVDRGLLGFGIRAGILRTGYDWNRISYKNENDLLVGADQTARVVPIFDLGVYYHRENKMFIGASIINVNNPNLDQKSTIETEVNRQFSNFTFTYGKIFEFNDRVMFRPSLLVQYTLNANVPPMADINLSWLFSQTIWLGVSYRTVNAISAIAEYEISREFRVGYSYDYYLGELSQFSSGAHEIFLGFNYNVFKSRMRSPRYYF